MTESPLSLITREDQEAHEAQSLAPYASLSARSAGRAHPSYDHPYRTCYQRDRDRLIHCAAFRRLEYKTQVFINRAGDHYRTRLTHTLEVAQIARTLGRMLRLNVDLCEAVALAHDLGHPPFGHGGERVLNARMADHGGFEHNAQALRIIDALEHRYPDFPGLNLTAETRRGLLKNKPAYTGMGEGLTPIAAIEAQVVDIADEISYGTHDLDDGIVSGLLRLDDVLNVPLWKEAADSIHEHAPELDERRMRYRLIVRLINEQVMDVAEETLRRLGEGVDPNTKVVVEFSPPMREKINATRTFLMQHLYRHPLVMRTNARCERIIHGLFDHYHQFPEHMSESFRQRVESDGRERCVADYIAGMTDRFAEEDFRQLFGF